MKKYKSLEWDSKFFDFKVGEISDLSLTAEDLSDILLSIAEENFNLIYYYTLTQLGHQEQISFAYDIKLVDKKVTYFKNVDSRLPIDSFISSYKKPYPENKLIELALESGIYSRFNNDEKIGQSKFEELYRIWIINSVNKTIAKEVLTYSENGEILGVVTLGEKNLRASIGIIATHNLHRGKGIGKKLIYAAENWSARHSYEVIEIVTQYENVPARALYERCGFKVQKIEYCYHFWKKE